MRVNLLEETECILEENGLSLSDIQWVGCRDVEIPLESFLELADQDYNNGYGSAEVAIDLVICGEDWYLERWEYDGTEGWSFKTPLKRPGRIMVPRRIMASYSTLEEMNTEQAIERDEKRKEMINKMKERG